MTLVRTQRVEIAVGHFAIQIYKDPNGTYRAEYEGFGLAKARPPGQATPLMEGIPGGRVSNCANPDEAFAKACAEIENQHGKIIRTQPPERSG